MVITADKQQVTAKDYKSEQKSTWCAGCGDFGILSAVQTALVNAGVAPWQVLLVAGIGCGSKLPDYINASGYMTLHGRGVTIASGAHLANTDLLVIAITGDGDGFGIGVGHAIHNMRRNMDIVHLLENNEVYGLTKGQYSPTSKRGFKTSTSPEGAIEFAVNPAALAITSGATLVARSYSGDPKHAAQMIQLGMEHKGYALIEILQTCPTYNKIQNNEWYKANSYKIEEELPNYDARDLSQAFNLCISDDSRYPLGVIYVNNERPTYAEQVPALQDNPKALVNHSLVLNESTMDKLKSVYV